MSQQPKDVEKLSPAEKRALLEKLLREKANKAQTIQPAPRTGPLWASFAQERLWFAEQLQPGEFAYNVPNPLRLKGTLDVGALERALGELQRRHEVLRTTFTTVDGRPAQVIAAPTPLRLPVVDLTGLPREQREAEATRLMHEEARQPFELSRGPLWRLQLLRLDAEDHLLLSTAHHIIVDNWSWAVLFRELSALYEAFHENKPSPLPALPVQYADYALWQREQLRGSTLEAQRSWWKQQLAGAPTVLQLPLDRPRPTVRKHHGRGTRFHLSLELREGLEALARREKASLFMVLTAAWQTLLSRYSGQTDISIGTPVAGRQRMELEGLLGFFINNLVLRTDLSGEPTFRELIARVREVALGAYAHQDVPFEQLVEELQPERSLSHSPLFQAMLNINTDVLQAVKLPGLTIEAAAPDPAVAQFDLLVSFEQNTRGGMDGWLVYATDIFDAETAQRMAGHLCTLLEAVVRAPDTRLERLPLLTEQERRTVVSRWNAVRAELPQEACLHRLFEAQVARTPQQVALDFAGTRLTYAELEARANRLAQALVRRGVKPETRVALFLERSAEQFITVLGILKAGGAYVPLDPGYPPERLAYMLEDCAPTVVVTHSRLRERLGAFSGQVLCLDEAGEELAGLGDAAPRVRVLSENTAYVIYTSGSTGRSKGVIVPHQGVCNMALELIARMGAGPGDRMTQLCSISFDGSVQEMFTALLSGATLVPATRDFQQLEQDLTTVLAESGLTSVGFVPSVLATLEPARLPGVKRLIAGGEAVPAELVERWAPQARFFNMYGPTEASVTVSVFECKAGGGRPPIGRPLANVQVYVLDAHLQPVPVGVAGELYVGGLGLARGYLDRQELTAERFIPDPVSGTPGARLYRTGDLVRYLADGNLEYLGRVDQQVKIRGYRIELGEIESALARHPMVREVAVVAREDVPGDKRLVAYVVADAEGFSAGALRQHLQDRLPPYMVPAAFARLDALPLTPNGKVDARALPPPPEERPEGESYQAPTTPVQEALARVFAQVLGVSRVGIHDDFFALGGHSLMATQVASRVREQLHVELPLRLLFESPTVAALAEAVQEVLGRAADTLPPIERVGRQGAPATSFAQERLWFLEQLRPGEATYNFPIALRLKGALDVEALERALGELRRRHETLRTTFVQEGERPVQRIAPPAALKLPVVDLTGLSPAEREAEENRLTLEETRAPFDLAQGPLWRLRLLRLGAQEHLLLSTMHHIITDGGSVEVLFTELAALYGAFREGRPSPLAELPVQYADFAAWQRQWLEGQALEEQLSYWKKQLAGAPALLELPTDKPRPAVQTYRGDVEPLSLTPQLVASLRALCQEEKASLFMLLAAAFKVVLARYSGQEDVSVGTPVSNRSRVELEGLIGFFANTLVLRTQLSGAPTFRELLRRVRETTLAAHARQDVPFEKLVEELQPERNLSHGPLFQVMFSLLTQARTPLELPGLKATATGLEVGATKFDLALSLEEKADRIEGGFEFNTALFERGTLTRMGQHLRTLLEAIVARPDEHIDRLPLLPATERQRMLGEWNATRIDFSTSTCVHELIEAQVARTPEATALVFEDKSLTYRELDTRANQLARHLRRLGVGPDSLVGLCLERSLDMVVAMLAIHKAGGAYVPLDPKYPKDRLSLMLEDSGATLVVTRRGLAARFEGTSARTVLLDVERESLSREDGGTPPRSAESHHLAYVLYTSGSTGRPKGVMVTHRNVANFFTAMDERLGKEPGTWLAVTSISFDISVLELLWTLSRGFKVVIQEDALGAATRPAVSSRKVGFSLFYFASDDEAAPGPQRYRLLMEGARFADEHGFEAVWTPERHFFGFGGLYPSPSVMSAALAAVTRRVHLRAGSVVAPLHNELRLTEEWALVDNLSNGRVGVSFASGWHADDFVLAPNQYAQRHQVMYRQLDTVRRLWRGESVELPNGVGEQVTVRVRPKPVQAELPVWVTAAGNVDTFRSAGRVGANVLTHLLGQTVEQLEQKIAAYREAWREAGHPGEGQVTLMLHTFVGPDAARVKETVRGPLSQYLRGTVDLVKTMSKTAQSAIQVSQGDAPSGADLDALLDAAFERYFTTAGLFGTPDECIAIVERLKNLGVDEVGCLIDFGVSTDEVLDSLRYLDEVRERASTGPREDYSLAAQLVRHGVTHLQCTPSLARAMLLEPRTAEALAPLQKLMVGGEALPEELATQLQRASRAELLNMYGPTETTVWSTTHSVTRAGHVSLGTPIANTQVYVLDTRLQPVPIGVPGELFIGGEGVVRGYLNRPDLTAQRFVADPFSADPDARLYRTGDLVRWRAHGTLEYLGRMDHQVKLRGHRIELGEIESLLSRLPGVRETVVVAREDSPGDKRLVAYVVPLPGHTLETRELGRQLSGQLPEYMVPSAFVSLPALPLTPNGKVDRKALPVPESTLPGDTGFVAPRTPVEEVVAGIFADVLRLERVGANDDFFTLGGHSLLATRVMARLREALGVELPLQRLFEAPTVSALANNFERRLRSQDSGVLPLRRVARDVAPELSFAQERYWVLHHLDAKSHVHNVPSAWRLTGPLDVSALERALSEVVRRHEILRTTFAVVGGRPAQVIHAPSAVSLPVMDLSSVAEPSRRAEVERHYREEGSRPFDLTQGPLWRQLLLRLGEREHVLLWTMHHVITDQHSNVILFQDLKACYEAFRAGRTPSLPELTLQYADFAQSQREWLTGKVLEEQIGWWKQQLAGAPTALELPTDRPRPAVLTFRGAHVPFHIPAPVQERLEQLSRHEGGTLFMTLLAAYGVLLSRYSGQEDVVIGSPVSGRSRTELDPIHGYFLNTLALRVRMEGRPTFRELLRRVRELSLGAYAHQELPFERLVAALQPERDLSRAPLTQTSLVLMPGTGAGFQLPELAVEPLEVDTGVARYELSLMLDMRPDGLGGVLEYNTDLFDRATIERMAHGFVALLESIVATPDARLFALSPWPRGERERVVRGWNDTHRDFPAEQPVQALFEAQVERSPDTVAVLFKDQRLSYRELDTRANQLAWYLRRQGLQPGERVALCVDPALEPIVALYAVLKAGGSYVPLDPTTPSERLAFIFRDAGIRTVLTQEHLAASLPTQSLQVVKLDADWGTISRESRERPPCVTVPQLPAYVIYTSGTTGEPKGVVVPHRAVVNHNTGIAARLGLRPGDRMLQFTPLNYDAAGEEIYPPLLSGATIVVRGELVPSHEFLDLIEREQLSVLSLPPAYLHQWASDMDRQGLKVPGSVRVVLLGGEKLMPETWRLWQRIGGERIPWFNVYGPTEATVTSALCEISTEGTGLETEVLPIGTPVPNAQMYLLDANLEPVLVGLPGEIFIGGAGLAHGYLNRPELTAEKFVPDPFSTEPGARLYRTGDLARFLPDGRIEFLGRSDHQVKLRGHRIELAEVEASLLKHPGIQEAVVVVRESPPGNKRLVAYFVPKQGPLPVGEVQGFMRDKLPAHMVPSTYVSLEALPLTSGGKVNRKALPAPDSVVAEDVAYMAPRTERETALARLWEEVLDVRPVGVTSNFFDLGGQSLLAIRLLGRAREELGLELPMVEFFERPTIEGMLREEQLLGEETEEETAPLALVPVQKEGTQRPVFCIHPLFGDVQVYYQLAHRLGTDQPTYALRAPERDSEETFDTVEERAAYYVDLIRRQQPRGPYTLLGYSTGATLALEVARRLQAQGQEVSLLGLLHGTLGVPGTARVGPEASDITVLDAHWEALKFEFTREYERFGRPERWVAMLEQARLGQGNSAFGAQDLHPYARVARSTLGALERYTPAPYSGRVVQFVAAEAAAPQAVTDDALGWRRLCQNLEVVSIPGDARTMLDAPHVEVLAERLAEHLKAQGR